MADFDHNDDPGADDFRPDQEEWLQEPDYGPEEDYDPAERDKVMQEWAADATPDDWWRDQLDSVHDPEHLNSLVEALVKGKCRRSDLLEALWAIKSAYRRQRPTRQQLRKLADSYEKLADVIPPSIGDDFGLDDWAEMRELMLRCAEHLKGAADPGKPNEKALRRAVVMSLLTLVRQDTRKPQYRLLSELLHLLVHDKTLTPANLRKMSSRAELPKKRPLRRKVSVKRLPFRRGWTTITSSKSAAQRRRQAWIAVGNIPERGQDNDV